MQNVLLHIANYALEDITQHTSDRAAHIGWADWLEQDDVCELCHIGGNLSEAFQSVSKRVSVYIQPYLCRGNKLNEVQLAEGKGNESCMVLIMGKLISSIKCMTMKCDFPFLIELHGWHEEFIANTSALESLHIFMMGFEGVEEANYFILLLKALCFVYKTQAHFSRRIHEERRTRMGLGSD